jgi:hypothetical protein
MKVKQIEKAQKTLLFSSVRQSRISNSLSHSTAVLKNKKASELLLITGLGSLHFLIKNGLPPADPPGTGLELFLDIFILSEN